MTPRPSVLVTGGAGFIGRTLAGKLAELGRRVIVLDNLLQHHDAAPPDPPRDGELVVGDVRDTRMLRDLLEREQPDTVYHLAAMHYIPACEADPPECISINTTGTASVLEACARVSLRPACVLASTGAVYAPAEHAHGEADPVAPVDVYGFSKMWLEQIAALYARRERMRIAVARLFNVYGRGETNPHLIPTLIEQALNGRVLHVGNLDTRRDYVHVDDVARALIAMGDHPRSRGMVTLNVGSGRAVSGHEVVAAIGAAAGHALEVVIDQSRLRKMDRRLLLSDPGRAEDVLGWRPQIAFEGGIADVVGASIAAGTRV